MSKRPQDTSAEEPDGGNPHIRFRGGPRQGDRPGLLNKRFHVYVTVSDLSQNIRFYSQLFGSALVVQLESDARAAGVGKLVPLTQTAETFFRRLGYQNIDRRHVSDDMRQCAEFRSLCPASASYMAKALVSLADAERADA